MCTTLQTGIAESIDAAGKKARYDAAAKKLISHKVILAQILRECVDEFRGVPASRIIAECFAGEPQVNTVPVDQDAPPDGDSRIIGSNTEDASVSEGRIQYDIRFTVKAPGCFDLIHLIINIEIQVAAKPGYAVERRGVYYCARLISAQKGTVFRGEEYHKIQKVYSIWICPDPMKRNKNSIVKYSIQPVEIVGNAELCEYDLLKLVIINLNEDGREAAQGIIRMLSILLSITEKPAEKKKVLSEDFHIPMEKEIEKEMNEMCNLSDGVMELGRLEGMEKGRAEGMEKGENKLASLITNLINRGRQNDVEKAANDPEYREKLYLELGIV